MRLSFDNKRFYWGLLAGLGLGVITQLVSYLFVAQQWGRPNPWFALTLHTLMFVIAAWKACADVQTVPEGYAVGLSFGIGMVIGVWATAAVALFIMAPGYLDLRQAGLLLPGALFKELPYALVAMMVGRWRGIRNESPSNTMDR